jgi:hypothetical protein
VFGDPRLHLRHDRAVLVGTCSTIFVASPRLLHLKMRRESVAPAGRTP